MSDWIEGPPPTDPHGNFAPGVLLDVINGSLILVGDINSLGGVCDDCPCDIRPDDVARHKIVWTREG